MGNWNGYHKCDTKRKCKNCRGNERMTEYYDSAYIILTCVNCFSRVRLSVNKATKKDKIYMGIRGL